MAEARRAVGASISIHALREEGDPHERSTVKGFTLISIHALREEGDAYGGGMA